MFDCYFKKAIFLGESVAYISKSKSRDETFTFNPQYGFSFSK